MIILNLHEFTGYSKTALLDFLNLQNERSFLVSIKKNVVQGDLGIDNMTLSFEYGLVAYMGHQLAEISNGFSYCVPYPKDKMPFRFGIRATNLKKLANLLYECIEMLFGARASEEFFIYQYKAHLFYIDAFDEKIEPHTWGLLSVVYGLMEND